MIITEAIVKLFPLFVMFAHALLGEFSTGLPKNFQFFRALLKKCAKKFGHSIISPYLCTAFPKQGRLAQLV